MTVLQKSKPTMTLSHLVALHEMLMKHQNVEHATQILDLYKKLDDQRFIVGFTGHFSAGKSSMINALLSEDILPKSPIPTSGNIVEITSDNDAARIIFRDNTVKTFKQPYDIDVIQAFCKDNQTVEKVELSTTKNTLPVGCSLMDTPGIDAADEADRLMTESALHLVDTLFYVMDYNHVQSEVNLTFLQKIQARRIPFYIIVNQIDKHDDKEMYFETFDDSVKQTFDQWGIKPQSIYFSSLMDEPSPYNGFQSIKTDLFNMLQTFPDYPATIDYAVDHIVNAHKQFMAEKQLEKAENTSNHTEEIVDLSDVHHLNDSIKTLQLKPEKIKESFQFVLHQTLNNAYLIPASLRDKAELFLESRQKDFKVGLFGSKHKTKTEQNIRLNDFLTDIQDNIRTTIQWKLRDKMIELLNSYEYATPELVRYTKEFSITFNGDDAVALIKRGATLNGEYVLRYTDDMSAEIKSKFKQEAQILWANIDAHIVDDVCIAIAYNKEKLEALEKTLARQNIRENLQIDLKQTYEVIDNILRNPEPSEQAWQLMTANDRQLTERIDETEELSQSNRPIIEPEKPSVVTQSTKTHLSIADTQAYIDQTIDTVEALPGFQTLIDDLQTRKQKLSDRKLTLALFGAFSAGKSSFANALMGKSILPSSPNPTTAVINEIAPVTHKHLHGTVVIHLKTEETLRQDIMSLTKELSPPNEAFSSLIKWLRTDEITHDEQLNKMHQAYLQAVLLGYDAHHNQLGETMTIEIDDFHTYITDETIACYIESVTLYYDCALTRQGITLVDTPGADSVNARHTNVAFDYIKYADAILYVTYYNHAISQADRDFLIQLGRVKEAFSLDKMFFIINASDLATNEKDLELVENYVEEQLRLLGIRHPNIFPVSSKLSLENKLLDQPLNEEMNHLETKLNNFIHNDLSTLSIQAAIWDMTRAYESMKRYIQTVSLNDHEKRDYEYALQAKRQQLLKMVAKTDVQLYVERIEQRIKRQLHYIGERFSIRFHDFFTESFNPTTITGSGKQARYSIQKAFKHLLDQTGYELLQEVRAVSLRVEQTFKHIMGDVFADFKTRSYAIDENIMLPIHEVESPDTPTYKQAFATIETEQFKFILNSFKGTKSFFERNEKEKMKESLFNALKPYMQKYINRHEDIMTDVYVNQWHTLFNRAQEHAAKDIEVYISNNLAMMNDTPDIDVLNQRLAKLDIIYDKIQTKGERIEE